MFFLSQIQAKPQIKIDNPIQNGADQSFQQMVSINVIFNNNVIDISRCSHFGMYIATFRLLTDSLRQARKIDKIDQLVLNQSVNYLIMEIQKFVGKLGHYSCFVFVLLFLLL